MRTERSTLSELTLMFLKHVGILLLTLCASLISPGLAQDQAAPRGMLSPRFLRRPSYPEIQHRLTTQGKRVPAPAGH
jgi:hypothetical protein